MSAPLHVTARPAKKYLTFSDRDALQDCRPVFRGTKSGRKHHDVDTNYDTLTLHLRTPDQPFTQLLFRAHQTCRAADGTETTVDWIAAPGAAGDPAPVLVLLPARLPGWNRYLINGHLSDITPYFQDAQIAWRGTAAYSFNPNSAAQIAMTPGVTALPRPPTGALPCELIPPGF